MAVSSRCIFVWTMTWLSILQLKFRTCPVRDVLQQLKRVVYIVCSLFNLLLKFKVSRKQRMILRTRDEDCFLSFFLMAFHLEPAEATAYKLRTRSSLIVQNQTSTVSKTLFLALWILGTLFRVLSLTNTLLSSDGSKSTVISCPDS